MSRGARGAALAAAVLALGLGSPHGARAAAWGEAFGAERDTFVFLGADGSLLRAPFSLASAETLWHPAGGEHLVRFVVSPDGRRVAWLSRVQDADTTRLWVDAPGGIRQRVRFFAFLPWRYGHPHSEPTAPTVEDRVSPGVRLVQSGSFVRRMASNPLEWTPDSRAVVFGYDDGVAAVPADSGMGFAVSMALAVELTSLAPAPIYLVDALVLRDEVRQVLPPSTAAEDSKNVLPYDEGQLSVLPFDQGNPNAMFTRGAAPGTYLLYPLAHRWRAFAAGGLSSRRPWVASPATVWWSEGRVIRAIRTHDPNPTVEVRARTPVAWLGYDAVHRDLLWAAGDGLWRRPEDGGREERLIRFGSPVRRGLAAADGSRIALATMDSVTVWEPATGAARSFAVAHASPSALWAGTAGELLLATDAGQGRPASLLRADAQERVLRPVALPALKQGMFREVAGGRKILYFDPAPRAPQELQVYDLAGGTWSTVENPGIAAWEPLAPH